MIALDGRERDDEGLRELARTLVGAGCIYSVAWGPQAGRMALIMDLLSIETEDARDVDVMTDEFGGNDRLREDYRAFDDARVAAEEEARRHTWIGRLRGKLALRR